MIQQRLIHLFKKDWICNWLIHSFFILGFMLNFANGVREQCGHPAVERRKLDSVKRAILVTDPSRPVLTAGQITEWHVYIHPNRRNQEVHLQVWRPQGQRMRSSDVYTAMTLVGFTKIISIWPGYNRFFLYPEDRIQVQPDDLLALYFPGYNPVPWTEVECRPGRAHLFLYNPRGVNIGSEKLFSTATLDWIPCRVYSYNCTIMSTSAAEAMDQRLQIMGESPYGKRPYGKYIPKELPTIVIANASNRVQTVHFLLVILSFTAIVDQFL